MHSRRTGGGPSTIEKLTSVEEKILAMIGRDCATGNPEVPECGFSPVVISNTAKSSENSPNSPEIDAECRIENFRTTLGPIRRRRRVRNRRMSSGTEEFLKQHIERQTEIMEAQSNSLQKILESLDFIVERLTENK